jgi:hypothetical protein
MSVLLVQDKGVQEGRSGDDDDSSRVTSTQPNNLTKEAAEPSKPAHVSPDMTSSGLYISTLS